ncbi:3-hydroxyacyl-[acyl-carrier-protein] dehydratase FabZ [Paraburkholderia caffeinitolerans]|uniref:3-hydroxyacyl-[acyl-carrier-protein] dehydratase FabZ n=1 Tax=Paraburkholderia caffeinitolerans TaxID=1723730 RepID=A0A6J5G096_9BURK|nr:MULTISPECIES: 3-hydroxyacyl-ACP dehydratase FabZ family protein [Paraburkholderia]CAB3790008.1 3-hydroxyacyl-[acyl-carrier-protein] dehydratase FabZ [Paraburkholderia caffeinitolerans]
MSKLDRSLMPAQQLFEIGVWRSPIFMVDRIADIVIGPKASITAVKHVTFNESYIAGHFTDNPVMPGVMIAEIFGQAGEYCAFFNDVCAAYEKETGRAAKRFEDVAEIISTPEGRRIIKEQKSQVIGFLAAQNVKFKRVVYPGDTIYAECRLAFTDTQGFNHFNVEARVGRHVAVEGTIINFRTYRDKLGSNVAAGISR